MIRALVLAVSLLAVLGCGATPEPAATAEAASAPAGWALAIHGGAGTVPRDIPDERRDAYLAALERALREGADRLEAGGTALDAVERVVAGMEDDPLFNAGRGAVFTSAAGHQLDASIMDGATLACGAVAAVETVRHPVRAARLVMERTPHVLLVGRGAEAFAADQGLETVDNGFFSTPRRREALRELQRRSAAEATGGGTVGAVALDRGGNLAAATSTGGLTGKLPGRVGDTPLIGAGTFADNRACAVSATGRGEEFIRRAVAHDVAARMLHGGADLEQAVAGLIDGALEPGDGGVIAVDAAGRIVMRFNTSGMYRGAADGAGRFEVAIW